MSLMTYRQVRDVLEKVNHKLEIPKPIFDSIKINFVKNKTVYGRATVTRNAYYCEKARDYKWGFDSTIILSDPLLSIVDEKQQEQTFAHELCHIADVVFNGRMSNHGQTWSDLMIKAGYEPVVKGPKLPSVVPGMITVRCDCKTFPITSNRATRMRKGANYRCGICRKILEFV